MVRRTLFVLRDARFFPRVERNVPPTSSSPEEKEHICLFLILSSVPAVV